MMTPRIRKIYKKGLMNKEFIQEIKKADNDVPPNVFSHINEKVNFASAYYGWLVGRYRSDWEIYL